MSIDYSNVKAMSDHIGDIVKITDASGNVMWKQAPSGATVTITVQDNSSGAKVVIDGIDYANSNTELTVPIGTVITINTTIYVLNGVSYGGQSTVSYTVVGDVEIVVKAQQVNPYYKAAMVQITEL